MNIRRYATLAALALALPVAGLAVAGCTSSGSMSSGQMVHQSMSHEQTMKQDSMGHDKMSDQGMMSNSMGHDNTATVATREKSPYGAYLVNAIGMSFYIFAADTRGSGKSTCYGKCAEVWPPVLTKGKPRAKEQAMADLLGTIERKDGTTQLTYNGWPLYYFVNDKPGSTGCQAVKSFGDVWYLLNAHGTVIRTK
ncbi:MAG: hypothetical protein L0I62_08685 [Gammaproteobacteria bacterium]|nr:hypothetical protein [Gammaproteobacteria bacterium]